ncbi:unnamed protein product [Blepharisma stoltei]|uniref:Ubiquitin-like domain-containing protein n=1 Tax=Blepharisma stoltei TaxID=1481888 RepID=A0AAU9K553_9CILI|nr:unnamed protein product [Blepharisma stoltei]
MNTYYNLQVKSPVSARAEIILQVPPTWNVSRVKELILQYHPESPSIRCQQLIHKGNILHNNTPLSSIFGQDRDQIIYLDIQLLPNPPDPEKTGFNSTAFKEREIEYLHKYDIVKQILIDTKHAEQSSQLIPEHSILNTLPLCHPDIGKRIKHMMDNEQPRRIRLQGVPLSVYFDIQMLMRWILFLFITQLYLGSSTNLDYYLFIFVLYLVNVRLKIEKHREKQLQRLPREYLAFIMPEKFGTVPRDMDKAKKIYVKCWETLRSFGMSFLPWFDPNDYAQMRARALNG